MSYLDMVLFRNVKVIMLLLMATNCMGVGGLWDRHQLKLPLPW